MAPAMETASKPFTLFAHEGQEQLPGFFRLLGPQILNVDLRRFVAELNFNFRATGTHPQEYLISCVQDHDVIMGQIVLEW